MKRNVLIASTIIIFIAAAVVQGFVLKEKPPRKPNVLFIITDQQFGDAMSCIAGDTYINTPSMDRLAASGTVFTRTYCANPVCIPSRASMFSGRYPQETGVLSHKYKGVNYTSFPSLGKIFQDNGYETGYVGKWHIPIDLKDASVHGFENLENMKHNGADINNSTEAIRFIKKKRKKPFFLVASYNNPHNICEWARGARGENLPDGNIGSPPSLDLCPPLLENNLPPEDETEIISKMRNLYQLSRVFPVGEFGEKEWREYRWAYYRMIELVDSQIAKVLDALQETDQQGETIIIFTSDHGDCQGAHGWNQKTVLYDESVRVPFIVSYPGKTAIKRSNQLVHSGIDIMPTLCDYAGIPIPKDLPGISLMPIANGNEKDTPRDYIVSQTRFLQGAPDIGVSLTPSGLMVRSKRFKYCIYDQGDHRESLIDMENDPGEMVNLARQERYKNILEQHRKYLSEWSNEFGDDFPLANFGE